LQITGLLGAVDSFLAVLPSGGVFRSSASGRKDLSSCRPKHGIGYPRRHRPITHQEKFNALIESALLEKINHAVQEGKAEVIGHVTIVPLRVGERVIGAIYLDRPILPEHMELVNVFGNQAAVAIHNSQLYEMATLDHLTGVYNRMFFEECLLRGSPGGLPFPGAVVPFDGGCGRHEKHQ